MKRFPARMGVLRGVWVFVVLCHQQGTAETPAPVGVPFGRELIVEDTEIKAGVYDLGQETVYVRRVEEKAPRVTLGLNPDVTLRGGRIAIDQCDLFGKGVRLLGVKVEPDWGAKATFEDSVFESCLFKKEDGRGYDRFSAKFVFENCVFTGSFFSSWGHKDAGVKASKCTFSGISFAKYEFAIDARSEVGYKGDHGLENCHFAGCTVPSSVLAFCDSCSFENCRFVDDSSQFKAAKTIAVSLEFFGDGNDFGLEDSAKIAFKQRVVTRRRGSRLEVPEAAGKATGTMAKAGGKTRTWTNTEGRKIEAALLGVEADDVLLMTGERETRYPRNKLGAVDRAFLDEWLNTNINWRSLPDSRRAALDHALVVSGRQITEAELAEGAVEKRASFTAGRKPFGVFSTYLDKSDVLQLHPDGKEKPARMDFSGITKKAKGTLRISLHDHRLGDVAFAVVRDGVAVEEGVLDQDMWRSVDVPFDHMDVALIISADDDWKFEFVYITYEFL